LRSKTRRHHIAALLTAAMTIAVLSAPVLRAQPSSAPAAQAPAATESAQPPAAQDGFVPVRPGELEQEQLPAAPLVFVAYSVVWIALLAYVFILWRRLVTVERELAEVAARVAARRP
jgi:CcmD family protein